MSVSQKNRLFAIVKTHPALWPIVSAPPFPDDVDWYLGAGCLCQSVWNSLLGLDPTYGIKDYDLVYFDDADLSSESEANHQKRIDKLFKDLNVSIEVVNEARVHLWYEKDYELEHHEPFPNTFTPYTSCQNSINTWPTTATANGIRTKNGQLELYSPFGLDDVFNLTVRANKRLITESVFNKKAARWQSKWPQLKIVPW